MESARPSVTPRRREVTPRRREVTRRRVIDAAREVFAERGVFGATVEDICAHAGFTRGAFYSNFGSKDEVLRELLAQEHAALLARVDEGLARLDTRSIEADAAAGAGGRLATTEIERLLRSVPVDRRFFLIQAELEIHALRDPAVVREFSAAQAAFRARIADVVGAGLAKVGRELVVDLDDATDTILAIVERSTRRALLAADEAGDADPTALSRAMLPLLLAAVSRPAEGR